MDTEATGVAETTGLSGELHPASAPIAIEATIATQIGPGCLFKREAIKMQHHFLPRMNLILPPSIRKYKSPSFRNREKLRQLSKV